MTFSLRMDLPRLPGQRKYSYMRDYKLPFVELDSGVSRSALCRLPKYYFCLHGSGRSCS